MNVSVDPVHLKKQHGNHVKVHQQMMRIHIENFSFDERGAEISWIKRVSPIQARRTPSGQSVGHPSPGGECLALLGVLDLERNHLMWNMTTSI